MHQPPAFLDELTLLIQKFYVGNGLFRFLRKKFFLGNRNGFLYFGFIAGHIKAKEFPHSKSSFPKYIVNNSFARLIRYFTSGRLIPKILAISFCLTS